ncbi:MAG: VOC family protein, partial [Pseudomonadota bacterium]
RRFYVDVLGFEVAYERPDEGFVFLNYGDAQLMIYQANVSRNLIPPGTTLTPPLGLGINMQIIVPDIAPLVQRLEAAWIDLALPVESRRYDVDGQTLAVRQMAICDPDGYYLRFSEQTPA